MFRKEELKNQIKAMGVVPTDTVIIHTSLKKIGEVEGGADTVIDAFKECLSEGLFLVPTHTWDEIGPKQPVYNVKTSVPCIGVLPTVAAFRKDGVRSLHPTHSMWATGRGAAEFVAGEEKAESPTPPTFAWDRLAEVNARILLLGVGNDKNTFIHSVDEVLDIPDRLSDKFFEATIVDSEGKEYKHPYRGHHCSRSDDVSQQFVNFDKAFIELGAMSFGKFGNAEVRIVDAAKAKEILIKILKNADRDLCIEKMDIPEEWYK